MRDSRSSTDPQAQLRRACAEMDRGLRAGEDAVAERLLESFPDLASCEELALELIYNEFVVRGELGQAPAIDDWYRRFPSHRDRLERLFHVDELLRDNKPGHSTNDNPRSTFAGRPAEGPSSSIGWLGRYELLEEIGRGGMGVVYKARQPGVERLVAVKMLRGPEPGSAELARLFNEARLVGQMHHPGIVQIFEAGEQDGQPFLALEFADGGSLDRWLNGKPLPAREAAEMTRDLCRAVQHAHEAGIVHRDLKPANVLLMTEGFGGSSSGDSTDRRSYAAPLPDGTVKITDFGLARQLSDPGGGTRSGQALGTASYMAPEQAEGRPGWAKPACDIYGLGAILYELLTGRPPHLDESVVRTLYLVVNADPVSPGLLRAGLPRDLETVCLKCLDKDPARRYATAADLAEDLNRFLDGLPVHARPLPWPARLWRKARRRPAVAGLVVVIAAALLALLAGWAHFTRQLGRQRDLAVDNNTRAKKEKQEADAQREIAVRKEADAQRELARARQMLTTATLLRAARLGEQDAHLAATLLDNRSLCPPECRDFAWGSLRRLMRRKFALLRGHPDRVRAACWLGDGSRVVTGGSDGGLVVWDAAERKEVFRFQGPTRVDSLARGPDDQIAIGGPGVILLHDAAGRRLKELRLRTAASVTGLLFLNRQSLVSVSAEGIALWDLPTGERADFAGPNGRPTTVALVAGGLLATGGGDLVVRLWDLQTRSLKRMVKGLPAMVSALAASADGKRLFCGDYKGGVRLLDLEGGNHRMLADFGARVECLAASADGRRVAWGTIQGRTHLFDVATNSLAETFVGHFHPVQAVAFSPGGRWLACGSGGSTAGQSSGELRLHDLQAKPWRPAGDPPPRGARSIASHFHYLLAVGAEPEKSAAPDPLRRFRVADGKELPPVGTMDRRNIHVAVSPDGKVAWTGGLDAVARGWDLGRNQVVASFRQPGPIRSMALSRDGGLIALACPGSNVRVVSSRDGEVVHDVGMPADKVGILHFSGDGKYLAFAAGGEGLMFIHRYDLAARRLLPPLKEPTTSLLWLPDHATLAVGRRSQVLLIDAVTGRRKAQMRGPTSGVGCMAVSPDGRTLACGEGDGTIRLFDLATEQERLLLHGHTAPVTDLAFRADGKMLSSASQRGNGGGEVLLWDSD